MPRVHLFEWEDQRWFPSFLRDFGTDFLAFLAQKTQMYKPIVPLIQHTMERASATSILDLASGGGGGLLSIYPDLQEAVGQLKVTLSDLYPNRQAFERIAEVYPGIQLENRSIDARSVPPDIGGLRTMFLSFHHFRSADAQRILQDAVDKRQPIAIFEAQERTLPSILAMVFSPITVLLTTPLIKPFRILRLVFTYLLPVLPLFILWDGIVSALRTYSVAEMNELTSRLQQGQKFDWEIGKVKSGPGKILYLIGSPK